MKIKKILLFAFITLLSFSMMACPSIQNSGPEIVQIVDGEMTKINRVTFEHIKGTNFDPEDMLDHIINVQNIRAIDYDQSGFVWGVNRDYIDISDRFEVTSFYAIWVDGDDSNFDGIVDEKDVELYGTVKTDQDGNKLYDQDKIFLVEVLNLETNFTIVVVDDDGASTEISGTIVIVE